MKQADQNKPQQPKKSKESSNPSKFLRFAAVGFQMGGTIYLGHLLGEWLDSKYNTLFWENTITLIAVFISMYLVISQVIKVTKDND